MKKKLHFLYVALVAMMLIPWQLNAQVLLNENFDLVESGVPTGWSVEGTAYDATSVYYNYAWQSTKGSYASGWNGTYGLYFNCYNASTGKTAILKSPVIDLSSSTKDMMLTFDLYDADEDEIKVYLSKDGGATYEENLLLTCEKIASWQTVEISLAAYKNEKNVSIVWYGVSSYGYSRPVIDNVSIAPLPTCAVAENMYVTEQEQTGAMLNWKLATGKGAAATNYVVAIYTADDVLVSSNTFSVGDDIELENGVYSYFAEGLTAGSAYYFTVKGVCSATDEAVLAKSDIFYTACNQSVLPLELDTVSETKLMPCWTMTDADYLDKTVYLNSARTIFATPILNHAANDIEVSLRYAGATKGAGFYYGVASDASCSDFDTLGYVQHTAAYSERKISVNTAGTKFGVATGKVFAIRPDSYMYVYGINVHQKPCCPRVEQVQAVATDSANIEVSWLGTAASYNITLVDTVTNNTINRTATTNPAVLGGLNPQTTYLVLVQANCGDCTSAWSDSIYVSTLCGVGQAIFAESFEYEDLGEVMPECWVQNKDNAWVVTHSISYYDTPSKAADGYSAIYMYGSNIAKGQTATFSPQPFKVETAGQYDVKFAMYRYSKGYYGTEGDGPLTVWANNRPDTVGAIKICEIDRYFDCAPAEKAEGWYYYDYNIPTITGTVYLVFEGKDNDNNSLYLDNIQVYPAATCRKVRNVVVDEANITTNSVSLKWDAAEGTSQWVIDYVVLAGTDTIKNDSLLISSNPYVISGLNHSTVYKIQGTVSTYCDAENRGEAVPFEYEFQTACMATSTFPFFEGFEGSFPPVCWDMKNTAGNSAFVWKQHDAAQYVYEGNYAAYWTYKSSGSKAILVTPEFVFENNKDYRIEFFAFRGTSGTSYAGEGFGVYLSETPNITEDSKLLTFIPRLTTETSENGILPVGTVSAQGMYQYKVDFNTAQYSGKYVIFEAITNNGYYQSFDNLWIGEKPAIDIIAKFSVDSVVIDAARINIPDETIAMFDLVYGPKGFDPETAGTLIDSIEGRVYNLVGITPDTEYDVYVRARNAAGQVSAWSRNPMSFRTLCSATDITAGVIFVENFDEYTVNDNFMGCLVQNYSGSYSFKVATEMEYYNSSTWEYEKITAKTGTNMAMINSSNGAWMFRAVNLKAGVNYSISADVVEWSSYYDAKLSMGVATTPDRTAVTKCLDSYVLPDRAGWERVTGYFTVPADGLYYVGLGAEYGSSSVGIDSLVIRTEAIIPPAVNITELTDSKVSFEITSNAASWEMYYATSKFAPDTIPAASLMKVTNKTYAVENLQSNTTYYYAFRAYSAENEVSSWTAVGSFRTECGAIALPIDFACETASPDCWTISGEGDVSLRAYNKQNGSYSWMLSGNKKLISPRVNGDLSNCEGSFWAAGYYEGESYTPKFIIGVMTNPQDPTTFKAVTDTITVNYIVENGQLQEFTFSLESLKENEVYKNAKYFVLEHIQGYTFFDALTVDLLPTCPKPTEFVATAVSANTVTLDWTAGGTETSWEVLVKQGNDTIQTLVANSHPFVVSNLTGNTTYNFELRAVCVAGVDSSKVINLNNITTACDVYAIPYANALNGIPACWTIEDSNADDRWAWFGYSDMIGLTSNFADSYAPDTARLFTPEFNFDKKSTLSIEMFTHYLTGTFNVLFDNGTTRDTLIANYQSHDAWDTVTVDMSSRKGQVGRIVFEGWGPKQSNDYNAYFYIRNLQIIEIVEAPAAPAIQYGGGYFAVDNLPVAVTTTETRPNYILVTIDGSEPSFEGVIAGTTLPAMAGQQIPMIATTTLKARTMLMTEAGQPYLTPDSTYLYSDVVSATFTKVTAPVAPEFTPAAGRYMDSVRVSIACATENVIIKYEFGALEPNGKSATYTESFLITAIDTTVVSAVAYLTDAQGAPIMDVNNLPIASEVARASYDVYPYVAPSAPNKPTIQYGGGYFAADMLSVALTTTETRPNYILVTIDGSEPSFEGVMAGTTLPATSGQPISLTATTIVKVRGMLMTEEGQPYKTPKGEYIYSDVVSAIFTKVAAPATPEFTPAEGEYIDSVVVSIACATENVMIKYEFGGTEPTGRSLTYTASFKLTETTVVSAIAYLTDALGTPIMDVEGLPIASQAKFAQYKVTPYVAPAAPATPSIQYPEGGYFAADMLPVAVTTKETRPNYILVTIDGSEPSFEGVMAGTTLPATSGQPISVTATTTIKVRGMLMTEEGQPYKTPKGEYIYSDVVSATFTKVAAPAAPEFTPAEGEYYDSVVVSIACATENVMIKYEFGGTEPTGRSLTYTASFKLTETTVVAAMAFLTDATGAPIMDVEGLPIASQATFAQYTIKPKQGVDVDNVEVAAIVYAKDGMVYVDTEIGNMIEVFTVQGQRIYAAEATAQLTTIDAYAADVVLVRVNGNTVKVAVR